MDTCYNCGGLIEFRTVDGVVTPIHITGGCWQNSNSPSELGGFQPLSRSSLRYESYVNPNAHCPVCGEQVFFYQSEYGGRVFFDELGPPWPKHPCTDNSIRYKATRSSSIEKYQWQKDGWEPFIGTTVEQNEGGITRITGSLRGHKRAWTLYILGTCPSLGKYPILIKAIDHEKGKYRIATFKFNKEKGFQEIYLDCTLPESYRNS